MPIEYWRHWAVNPVRRYGYGTWTRACNYLSRR